METNLQTLFCRHSNPKKNFHFAKLLHLFTFEFQQYLLPFRTLYDLCCKSQNDRNANYSLLNFTKNYLYLYHLQLTRFFWYFHKYSCVTSYFKGILKLQCLSCCLSMRKGSGKENKDCNWNPNFTNYWTDPKSLKSR